MGSIKHNGICKYTIVPHMYTHVTYWLSFRTCYRYQPFSWWIDLRKLRACIPALFHFWNVMARIGVLVEDSASYSCMVNIIVLMATCVAKASATMVLVSRNIKLWTPEGLISKQTNWYDKIKAEKECVWGGGGGGGRQLMMMIMKYNETNRE